MLSSDTNPYVRDFLDYLSVVKGCSVWTINSYRDDLIALMAFLETEFNTPARSFNPSAVTAAHIRRFLSYCRDTRGNTNRTLARKLSALKSFYRFLTQHYEGLVITDPTAKFPAIRFERRLPTYFTLDEAKAFLDSILVTSPDPVQHYAIFTVFLHCGCRLAEVVNLKVGDVDLQNGSVRVFGKGRKERVIPLTDHARQALERYCRTRPNAGPDEPLFLTRKGLPFADHQMQYLFRVLLGKSPVAKPGMTIHKLRHTCLTLLLLGGADIRSLKEIAGHADISTTQLYTHVTQTELRKQIARHPLANGPGPTL